MTSRVRGERHRGSTKETNETRAQKAAALKLAATIKGSDPLDRKPPTLREYSKDFLQWAETGGSRPTAAAITEMAGDYWSRRRSPECATLANSPACEWRTWISMPGGSDEVGTGKGRQDQGGEPAVQKSIKLI